MYLLQSVKALNVYVLSNSQLRSTKITKCVLFQISVVRILFWVHEVGAWYHGRLASFRVPQNTCDHVKLIDPNTKFAYHQE